MKKIICAVLCLMMLATFISAACADEIKFNYTLWSRTVTVRAAARAGYKAKISGCLYVTFRRADHLTGGGQNYTNDSGTKTSSYGAVGQNSPAIKLSVSANNSADDFVSAYIAGRYYYKK